MQPILILGIGNMLLQDEGVGVRAIEELKHHDLGPGVDLLDGGTSGADIVDYIADRQKVIVIDAIHSDQPPGTIFRFTDEDLMARQEGDFSLHEFGLMETLMMARRLACPPKEVVIFGVVPSEVQFGLELSQQVEKALPKLIEAILNELKGIKATTA